MPRSRNSRRAGTGATATLDPTPEIEDTADMTSVDTTPDDVDTDDAVSFDLSMEAAPSDFQPDRKVPGRQRRPSFFDDKLRASDVYDQGWQRVPVTSQEHKEFVVRELNRSKLYLNGTGRQEGEDEIGLDLDEKQDDAVYFKSRKAQKRERKANGNAEALTENASDEGLVDPNGDNDE